MDVKNFVDQTLRGLAVIPQVLDTAVTAEGPIVDGYALISDSLYLHFYFNAKRGTIAFALIRGEERIWGVDYDNRRGWHVHPLGDTQHHQSISAQSISGVLHSFSVVLDELSKTR